MGSIFYPNCRKLLRAPQTWGGDDQASRGTPLLNQEGWRGRARVVSGIRARPQPYHAPKRGREVHAGLRTSMIDFA